MQNSICSNMEFRTDLALENKAFSFREFILHFHRTLDCYFNVAQSLTQVPSPLVNAGEVVLTTIQVFKEPVLSGNTIRH